MPKLQFFTDEKIRANQSHLEYERYWHDNRKYLPEALLRINGGMLPESMFHRPDWAIFLHDARIQVFEQAEEEIRMMLHGDHQGGRREIHLHYRGVRKLMPVSEKLLSNTPQADLMVHETTLSSDGLYRHTMLFANGELVSIEFSEFNVRFVDR